ncbi:S1 family peptidase [Herminiimonas aquatilis]|uniref:Serine protease n=1 Tax=Herminiimonas aquatilis TaxID=345342 RepID=A0ABW2J421_9BURK
MNNLEKIKPSTSGACITVPDLGPLQMQLIWDRPVFTAIDGIGEQEGLNISKGQVLAIGYISEHGPRCVGSGIMVGAGLLITATHVLDELQGKNIFAFSFVEHKHVRIWALRDTNAFRGHIETIPSQLPRTRRSDVAVASCVPVSEDANKWPLAMGVVEMAIPRVGERLWAVGFREETTPDGEINLTSLCSSGCVISYLLNGRGNHLPGPIVEINMDTYGGMSGGPVFNEAGHVVGVVSASLEWEGGNGPTYVSLIWSAALEKVYAPWPKNYWPTEYAVLQGGAEQSRTQLRGSAKSVNGILSIQFDGTKPDYILERLGDNYKKILEDNRQRLADEGDNDFYTFLEEEGEDALRTLPPKTVVDGFTENESLFAGALKIQTSCLEGIEDTEIHTIEILEDGNLNLDVTYNLRGFVITVTINRFDFEERREDFEAAQWCWNIQEYQDTVDVECGVRPYFRAGFTLSPSDKACSDYTVYSIRIKI